MSRSFKKHPINKGANSKRWVKRQAAKKVRRSEDVPDGKGYCKFYNSWNICDNIWRMTWNEFFQRAHAWHMFTVCVKSYVVKTEPTRERRPWIFGPGPLDVKSGGYYVREYRKFVFEHRWEPGWDYDKWVKSRSEKPFEIWLRHRFIKLYIGK